MYWRGRDVLTLGQSVNSDGKCKRSFGSHIAHGNSLFNISSKKALHPQNPNVYNCYQWNIHIVPRPGVLPRMPNTPGWAHRWRDLKPFSWHVTAGFRSPLHQSACSPFPERTKQSCHTSEVTYLRRVHLPLKRTAAIQHTVLYQVTEHPGLGWPSLSPERPLCSLLPCSSKILGVCEEYSQKPASAQPPNLCRFPLQSVEGN